MGQQQEGHLPPETVRELGLVHGTVFTLLGRTGYYVRAGSRGPPLILIPGSFGDTAVLHVLLKRLPPDLHVILVDLPGHGTSWPPVLHDSSVEELTAEGPLVRALHFLSRQCHPTLGSV